MFMPEILQAVVGVLLLWGIYALVVVLLKLSEEDRLVLGRLWARLGAGVPKASSLDQG
jgi:hypothetical protein